mmetsp:Transcript_86262/g.279272  ORF Transcript_86262/g.279272 Transcript_86262/m.279272 type:complete len:245 (-) Transcript_86262:1294-2028(-)
MCTGTPGWKRAVSSASASCSPGSSARRPFCTPARLPARRHAPRSTRTQRARPSGLPGGSGSGPCSSRSRWRLRSAGSKPWAWWATHCSWNSSCPRSCGQPPGSFAPDCRSSPARGKSTRSRSRGPRMSRARPRGTSAAAASSMSAARAPSSVAHGSCRWRARSSQRAPPSRSATPPSKGSRDALSVRSSNVTAPSIEPATPAASPPLPSARRRSSSVSRSLLRARSLERSRLSRSPMSGTGGMA